MAIRRRVAFWISKAIRAQAHARAHEPIPIHTRTYALARAHTQKYAIVIAFPQQQWFHKRASMLRYTHIACIVVT
jgi:hypothetical protein